jgi:hypothetical protein
MMVDHIKEMAVRKKVKKVQRKVPENKKGSQDKFELILKIGNLILVAIEIARFIIDYLIK